MRLAPRLARLALVALATATAACTIDVPAASAQGAGPDARAVRELDARIAAVKEGRVRLSFATRPEVCGNGQSITRGVRGNTTWGNWDDIKNRQTVDLEWDVDCARGPGRIVLEVEGGQITRLRTYVGGRWREPSASGAPVTDLGMVSAPALAEWLVAFAERAGGKANQEAVFPATLADSAAPWPGLFRLARNERASTAARKNAVFWLGQAAGDAATRGLDELVGEKAVDREVKESAVFALSQRPPSEGVPVLIRVARTHQDPKIRRSALFWLGQSRDPRAVALFEELLLGK